MKTAEEKESAMEHAARMLLELSREEVQQTPSSEVAEHVLLNFDVRILGEELAVLVICEIVNHVPFPSGEEELKRRIIRSAEEKLPEILGANPYHEFHSAECEVIERMLIVDGASIEDVKHSFGRTT